MDAEKLQELAKNILYPDHGLSNTMIIHTYCESQIDDIINKSCQRPALILKWTYRYKLEFIYSTGLITEPLYYNLTQLGAIRNKYAHNTNFDIGSYQNLTFKNREGQSINVRHLFAMLTVAVEKHLIMSSLEQILAYTLYGLMFGYKPTAQGDAPF